MRYLTLALGGIAVLLTSCQAVKEAPAATAPPTAAPAAAVPAAAVPAAAVPVTPVDTSKSGVYRSGRWEYRCTVQNAGTKSQGYHGKLLFDGKPVPAAGLNDYYRTPWGKLHWVGQPIVMWGGHGWAPRAVPSRPAGRQLPDPAAAADRPVVMAQVLAGADSPAGKQPKIEKWVGEELKKLKVKHVRIQRDWFRLSDQAVTIHNTKRWGILTMRLAEPRGGKALTVVFDGTRAVKVQLPRKDGSKRLVRQSLPSSISETKHFYVAFRVARAARGAPEAREIGPEANGKTVRVKGASRVIIKLPGNRSTGFAWAVTSIEGKSVRADGRAQYTPGALSGSRPGAGGTYEAAFRVVGKGKATVKMAYRRAWQTGKPPEKTFRVTLDVRDVPAARTGK